MEVGQLGAGDPIGFEDRLKNYTIGCILLEQPFFLPEDLWIPIPEDWAPNIVRGKGFVTVTPEHRFEVSRRIREEFDNGRDYYALHGSKISCPTGKQHAPDPATLAWHNDSVFLG